MIYRPIHLTYSIPRKPHLKAHAGVASRPNILNKSPSHQLHVHPYLVHLSREYLICECVHLCMVIWASWLDKLPLRLLIICLGTLSILSHSIKTSLNIYRQYQTIIMCHLTTAHTEHCFHNGFDKFINTWARMFDSTLYLSFDTKATLNWYFFAMQSPRFCHNYSTMLWPSLHVNHYRYITCFFMH